MEADKSETPATRCSTIGPEVPPDQSASHRSLNSKTLTTGVPTAVVYCEGNFGHIDGKTANGLVRHSQAYRVVSVIDSRLDGSDSGQVLDNVNNGIPNHKDLEATVVCEASIPDTLIYGMAPSTGKLSVTERCVMLHAIALGMNIVSGLHEYLGDDPEISSAADAANVTIRDIRKPRSSKDMRLFDGSVSKVKAIRIAVLGTDCAIGKRTTATVLAKALMRMGSKRSSSAPGRPGSCRAQSTGSPWTPYHRSFVAGNLSA